MGAIFSTATYIYISLLGPDAVHAFTQGGEVIRDAGNGEDLVSGPLEINTRWVMELVGEVVCGTVRS
jgi:hypothetical protein